MQIRVSSTKPGSPPASSILTTSLSFLLTANLLNFSLQSFFKLPIKLTEPAYLGLTTLLQPLLNQWESYLSERQCSRQSKPLLLQKPLFLICQRQPNNLLGLGKVGSRAARRCQRGTRNPAPPLQYGVKYLLCRVLHMQWGHLDALFSTAPTICKRESE